MDRLFDKLFWITDAHFGRSGNSPIANADNLNFLRWAVDRARSWGAETCIFGGDWFDNRHTVGVLTMAAALDGMDLLSTSFQKVYLLPGNHDLPYRDKRDGASIEFGRTYENIEIVREPKKIGDATLLPWLVGDEHKKLAGPFGRYVFGHLELPGFLLNSRVEMPDSPDALKADRFGREVEYVFSGHFHMRQQKGKVIYTGNIMPFNFTDAGDDARGAMLLEWGKDPIFEAWPDQPLFRTVKLSELVVDPSKAVVPRVTLRAAIDIDLPYEDAQALRDALVSDFGARRIELIPAARDDHAAEPEADAPVYQSVDQMVIESLKAVDSAGLQTERLIAIYRGIADA